MAARSARRRRVRRAEAGFTLLEVIVAFAILALALTYLLGLRSSSLAKATEGRNVRIAAVLARQLLAEVTAGQHDVYMERGNESPFEDFEGFSFRFVLGESNIAQAQSSALELESQSPELDQRRERLEWLNERTRYRMDNAAGIGAGERSVYEEEVEEPEELDAETFEEIAVVIRYPAPTRESLFAELILRSRVSTLALSGQTPEEASPGAGPTPISSGTSNGASR